MWRLHRYTATVLSSLSKADETRNYPSQDPVPRTDAAAATVDARCRREGGPPPGCPWPSPAGGCRGARVTALAAFANKACRSECPHRFAAWSPHNTITRSHGTARQHVARGGMLCSCMQVDVCHKRNELNARACDGEKPQMSLVLALAPWCSSIRAMGMLPRMAA